MNTKEIKPKTLISVLAAAIREDAESIAQEIVKKAKNDNVDYASLVEQFVFDKRDSRSITFSTFSEKAFEQIKDVEELKDFSVELRCSWHKKGDPEQFIYGNKNEFFITANLKVNTNDYWGKSARAYGKNAYYTFEEFKKDLQKKIFSENDTPTDVDLPENTQTEIDSITIKDDM